MEHVLDPPVLPLLAVAKILSVFLSRSTRIGGDLQVINTTSVLERDVGFIVSRCLGPHDGGVTTKFIKQHLCFTFSIFKILADFWIGDVRITKTVTRLQMIFICPADWPHKIWWKFILSITSTSNFKVGFLVGKLERGVVAGVDDIVVLLDGSKHVSHQVGVVWSLRDVVVTFYCFSAERPVG